MSCAIDRGLRIADLCRDGFGGANRLFIGEYFSEFSPGLTGSYGNVIESWGSATPSFYIFEQGDEVMSFTVPGEFTNTNAFWRPAVTMQIPQMTDINNGLAQTIARGAWFIIVEDNSGKYWFLNRKKPMRVTEGTAGTGQAATDDNGITLTLSAASRELPLEIDPDLMVAPVIVPFP